MMILKFSISRHACFFYSLLKSSDSHGSALPHFDSLSHENNPSDFSPSFCCFYIFSRIVLKVEEVLRERVEMSVKIAEAAKDVDGTRFL